MPPFGNTEPSSNVVQFPFPEKIEDMKPLHIAELDKYFGNLIALYEKSHVKELTKFNFETLRQKMVDEGGLSQGTFEAYLLSKHLTWEGLKNPEDYKVKKHRYVIR